VSTMLLNHRKRVSQEDRICQERIRQASLSFNLCVAFVGTSAVITLVGFVFLLSGHMSKSAYAAAIGGLTSTAIGGRCVQLSRESNDRLDRFAHELNDEDKIE
jgi:hypothetical protein